MVGERLSRRVLAFTPVNDRLATIHIGAIFFNITLIRANVPVEEKDDMTKDAFFERMDNMITATATMSKLCLVILTHI